MQHCSSAAIITVTLWRTQILETFPPLMFSLSGFKLTLYKLQKNSICSNENCDFLHTRTVFRMGHLKAGCQSTAVQQAVLS